MYLSDVEDTRDAVSDLTDFEFNAARIHPPIISPSTMRETVRSGKHLSVFVDEFHIGGTHTDWAIGVLHDLVDAIHKVRDAKHVRFCAATNSCLQSSSLNSAALSIASWRISAPSSNSGITQEKTLVFSHDIDFDASRRAEGDELGQASKA